MDQQTVLFSNKSLKAMIIPLFLEQLLIMLVGMADTLVVSYAGEAAVSGVSLVNQFNTIFIYLFTALASGGAVVISQYIGRKKNDDAGESASQLLSFSTIFSILIAVIVLIGNEGMLRLMFGKVEDSVMRSCITSSIVNPLCQHCVLCVWSIYSNKSALFFLSYSPFYLLATFLTVGLLSLIDYSFSHNSSLSHNATAARATEPIIYLGFCLAMSIRIINEYHTSFVHAKDRRHCY